LRPLLLVLPATALVAVFFVWPVISVGLDSVRVPTTGLDNYRWVFDDDLNMDVIKRTFVTALAVAALTVVVAYPYAYLMAHVGPRARNVLYVIVLVPLWTSLMVRTIAWMLLMQDSGLINQVLTGLGADPIALIRTTKGVTIAMVQLLLPFVVLPMYSRMSKIDSRLIPAAVGLGARPSVAFARIYLPLSMPGVAAGALTAFVFALGFYVIPALLGTPKHALMSSAIAREVSLFLPGRAAALAMVLLVMTLASLGLCFLVYRLKTRRVRIT
jgi:putative spermidine/putrescine transport system permease protein